MQTTDLFRKKISLLLDFDGTLADIVPDPMAVRVNPALIKAIDKIATEKHIPLAIVTGRQIRVIDQFLNLPHIPVSGNHGTEIRLPGAKVVTRHVPPIPAAMWLILRSICKEFECMLEDKAETAVIHAMNEAAFHAAKHDLTGMLSEHFHGYYLWPVGMSLEIHNRSCGKVRGIEELLTTELFKKNLPVYIGDDVRTYPGIEKLAARKVCLIPVGPEEREGFSSPAAVREFILQYADYEQEGRNSLSALIAEWGFLSRGGM